MQDHSSRKGQTIVTRISCWSRSIAHLLQTMFLCLDTVCYEFEKNENVLGFTHRTCIGSARRPGTSLV